MSVPPPPGNHPSPGSGDGGTPPPKKRKLLLIVGIVVGVLLLCCAGGAAVVVFGGGAVFLHGKAEEAQEEKAQAKAAFEVVIRNKVTMSVNNTTYNAVETNMGTYVVAAGELESTDEYKGRSRNAQQAADEYTALQPGDKYKAAASDLPNSGTSGIRNLWTLEKLTGNSPPSNPGGSPGPAQPSSGGMIGGFGN